MYRYTVEPYYTDDRHRAITIVADGFEVHNNGNLVRFTRGETCVAMFNLDHVGFYYVGEYHDPLEVPPEPTADTGVTEFEE